MGFFDKIKQKFSNINVSDKTSEATVEQIEQAEIESKQNEVPVESTVESPDTATISEVIIEQLPEDSANTELASETTAEPQEHAPVVQSVEAPLQSIIESVSDIHLEENEIEVEQKHEEKKSFFSKVSSAIKSTFGVEKIKEGLTKTRKTFSDNLRKVLGTGRKIDENLLSEIEELLITADIGVDTTEQIIEALRQRVKKENWENSEDLYQLLRDEIKKIMIESPSANNDKLYEIDSSSKPYVILVIGVNGVGKTTTIGKLAYNYKNANKDVIIGAADTFRAAANEQLEIWAKRAEVDIVQQQQGADPASVAYDTLKTAQTKNKDVVIIDTAGRLHNKKHLMDELEKITRVMRKLKDNAPDEVFLVLDATTGQNAIFQAKEFSKVAPITGIVLTKLDGTAKGGVVIPIANELKIPVRYIGVGEKIEDLQPFDAQAFASGLFESNDTNESEV